MKTWNIVTNGQLAKDRSYLTVEADAFTEENGTLRFYKNPDPKRLLAGEQLPPPEVVATVAPGQWMFVEELRGEPKPREVTADKPNVKLAEFMQFKAIFEKLERGEFQNLTANELRLMAASLSSPL